MASAMAAAPQVHLAAKLSSSHNVANGSSFALVGGPVVSAHPNASLKLRSVRSELKNGESNLQKVIQTAAVATMVSASVASPASAIDAVALNAAITQIEDVAGQVGTAASTAYNYASDITGQVIEVLTPLVKAALPIVKQATQSAIEIATPIASDVAVQAQKALIDAGVDTSPVLETAKTAVSVAGVVTETTGRALEAATPVASSTYQSLSSLETPILAAGAGGLVLLYLLAPSFASSVAYAARGYAGELTAAQTLDLLTQTDYTLVDVRTEKERGKSGVPSLPRSVSNKLVSVPVEEVSSKLRGQLRNPKQVEAELAAIKVAALKRFSKSSKIAILDSNGNSSKQVAKALSALGFKNTYIVKDGMDGRNGWVQSQLGTEDYSYGQAEYLSPSRVIPAAATRIFRSKSSNEVVDVPRRGFLLPGSSDE